MRFDTKEVVDLSAALRVARRSLRQIFMMRRKSPGRCIVLNEPRFAPERTRQKAAPSGEKRDFWKQTRLPCIGYFFRFS